MDDAHDVADRPGLLRANASAEEIETLLSNLARPSYLVSLARTLRLPEHERWTPANAAAFEAATWDVFTLTWLSQKRRAAGWMERLGQISDGLSLVWAMIDLILNSSVPTDEASSSWWANPDVRIHVLAALMSRAPAAPVSRPSARS